MSAALIEIRGISKFFGAVTALDRVNLVLHPGEVLGVVGDNGAGKTTLMKVLSGVHQHDAGQILWHGKHVRFGKRTKEQNNKTIISKPFVPLVPCSFVRP